MSEKVILSKHFGVYCIEHIATGKLYVGSTIKCFSHRWSIHRCALRKGNHHSPHLQRSWVKHGESAFRFKILEICKEKDGVRLSEHSWMNRLKPSFNVCKDPFSNAKYFNAGRARAASRREKNYVIANPEANLTSIKNLRLFCIRRGFEYKNFHAVASGRRSHYKGWVLPCETRIKTLEKIALVLDRGAALRKTYSLLSPSGQIHTTNNLEKFCHENHLTKQLIQRLKSGKAKTHKGWTLIS